MNKICTTLAQSKELMELGLDPNTADMFWDTLISKKPEAHVWNHYFIDELSDDRIPAWSLGTLIDLIPAATFLQEVDDMCYGSIEIDNKDLMEEAREGFGSSTIKTIKADNLFDVVYGLVAWYLTNKR